MSAPPTRRWSLTTTQTMFVLLYVTLVVVYLSVLLTYPRAWDPLVLISFTVLLLVHGALHLVAFRSETLPAHRLLYVVVQGVLVVLMILVTGGQGLTAILVFIVAGEAYYLFATPWGVMVTALVFGLAWLVVFYFLGKGMLPLDTLMQGVVGLLFVGVYVMMFAQHERERQRTEELLRELEVAHRQLQEYADRVESLTLSQERQRMARELHDTLAQGVAGLILQLEAVDGLLEQGNTTRAQGVVQQAMARARTTLTDARRAIQALRAEPLGQGGLLDALRDAVRDLDATGTPCDLEVGTGEWDLPVPLAEHVLRIVQEGLVNVARHASATRAVVRLSRDTQGVQVEIQDDGVGFDPAVVGRDGHFGLLGLWERVQSVGGTLEIESAPGQGSHLVAHLPLAMEDRDG